MQNMKNMLNKDEHERLALLSLIVHLELFLHRRVDIGPRPREGGQQLVVDGLQPLPQCVYKVSINPLVTILGPVLRIVLNVDIW